MSLTGHFASLGAFRADGARDTASWLRDNTHLSGRTAKHLADASRAARAIPAVADALHNGALTVEHAAALAPLCDTIAAGKAHADLLAPLLAAATTIPGETARRISCNAAIIPIVLGANCEPLDVGRAQRLATPAHRTALAVRTRTCEFAGCTIPATWCKAHHLDPWEHGGPTNIEKLVLVCEHHHHMIHEGGWTLERTNGTTHTRRPGGTDRCDAPPDQAARQAA